MRLTKRLVELEEERFEEESDESDSSKFLFSSVMNDYPNEEC